MKSIAVAALISSALIGCSTMTLSDTSAAEAVSIPTLLANPSTYQGRLVRIRGAVIARFEAEFICQDLGQIDSNRSKECLWLAPGLVGQGLGPDELSQYHGKLVLLTGKFNKDFRGHMGEYGGAITPVNVQILGTHSKGNVPPPPPEPSANNSFKPNLLRSSKSVA